MKNIKLTSLPTRPIPLDTNSDAIRLMMKSLPQSKWIATTTPFPHSFCKIDKTGLDRDNFTASFYFPGETVEFKDGTRYEVQHDKSLRRIRQ